MRGNEAIDVGGKELPERIERRARAFARAFPRALGALACCAAPALADDWYVDAAHGDDANGGTSAADAWKTITHALAAAPAPPAGQTQTVHVAPGLYDSALGETFPILLRDAFELAGDEGADVTRVDAGGAAAAMSASISHFGGNFTGPLTRVRGLTLANAGYGVDLQSSVGTLYLTVEDCVVEAATGAGFRAHSFCGTGCGRTQTTLARVRIQGCGIGVAFLNDNQSVSTFGATFDLADCVIDGSTFTGIYQYDVGGGTATTLARTRIQNSGSEGLRMVHDDLLISSETAATLVDCLIANNGSDGIRGEVLIDDIVNSQLRIDVVRCTIAGNQNGIAAILPTGFHPHLQVSLSGSILYGNQDDVLQNPGNPVFGPVSYCDIGDGDFAGSNGNFAADPLFVDTASGDFRLKWASPCIETGDPATTPGAPDLAGNARPIDGDLDTLERIDVGAFEFAPLFMKTTGAIGTPLTFELWGPQGNATTLYFSRHPLVAPIMTQFGELELDPAATGVFRITTVGAGPPRIITRTIPNQVGLIGRTFAFQALTDCGAAPLGKAYTNGVEITLVP